MWISRLFHIHTYSIIRDRQWVRRANRWEFAGSYGFVRTGRGINWRISWRQIQGGITNFCLFFHTVVNFYFDMHVYQIIIYSFAGTPLWFHVFNYCSIDGCFCQRYFRNLSDGNIDRYHKYGSSI